MIVIDENRDFPNCGTALKMICKNITLYYINYRQIPNQVMTMAKSSGSEVISFKVDDALKKAMEGISNRSEFIRAAILAALDDTCPLCKGTGILTPHQHEHWQEFSKNHVMRKCKECDSWILSCKKGNAPPTDKCKE